MSCLCIFRQKGRSKKLKLTELLVHRINTEPKVTTMKYSMEVTRDFALFEQEEIKIDNFKKAYQNHF